MIPATVTPGTETHVARWHGVNSSTCLGSSLQAKVRLEAAGSTLELLQRHQNDLRYLFIVSQVELGNASEGEGLSITIAVADGQKCERCWHWETDIGSHPEHPTICARCAKAVLSTRIESL